MADTTYRLRARIKRRSREQVEWAAQRMALTLNNLAPKKTGNLRNSQEVHISESSDRISVSIRYPVDYAMYTNDGWEGGPILPKNKEALVFYWENGPRGPRDYYFLEIRNHPGWEGTKWYSSTVTPEYWQSLLQKSADIISS